MKFGYNRPCDFRGEVVWNCAQREDGGRRRTTETAFTISFHRAFGSRELKLSKRQNKILILSSIFYKDIYFNNIIYQFAIKA